MNDYQQKRYGEYTLPQTVYRQALWAVKDLERLKTRKKEVEEDANFLHSLDFGRQISIKGGMVVCDNTARYAIDIVMLNSRISAIEKAFEIIPNEYRKGIYDKLVFDVPYNDKHCSNTWKKWQQVVLYNVAMNLNLL